jgi:hypothetical protein
LSLLTYPTIRRTCLPPLFDRDNVYAFPIYPYPAALANDPRPIRRVYRSVEIENEFLRVTVLPDLGGRIYQIEDRETGAAYLHENRCVRPTRIPPRWNYISLGIELNFPYTHSPSGNDPVGYELIRDQDDGMIGVAVGEQERQWGLSWRAEVRLHRGYRGVIVAVRGWNDTSVSRAVQWWSNAAQPADGDVEFVFPAEPIVAHIEGEGNGTWPIFNTIDLRRHKNFDRMVGTFHHPSTADWFGIYHHERQWGLLHLADADRLPGKKLWSFGHTGDTSDWTLTMTRDGGRNCEIQAGIPAVQDQHLDLGPGETCTFVEVWQPIDRRSELDDGERPAFADVAESVGGFRDAPRSLPPAGCRVPGFLWRELLKAWRADEASRLADLEERLSDEETEWPPSGYADLEQALAWAEERRPSCTLWPFMRGIHACAMDDWDTAASRLQDVATSANEESGWRRPGTPRAIARALQARILLNVMKQTEGAISLLTEAARELHDGSVLEEADTLLRDQGRTSERRELLPWWPDEDQRKLEVVASIEIDDDNPRKGLEILLGTPWERHHCRHRRTTLWMQARTLLNEPVEPVPVALNEDPFVVSQ